MPEAAAFSRYRVRYRRTHLFAVEPADVWALVEEPHLFPRMWPWMKDASLSGERIEPGARLSFLIDPPFPYRMRVDAIFTSVVVNERVEADISGDLDGVARLVLRDHPRGARADVSWLVELKQKRMRLAANVARPVLMRGHNWAVEVALRGFRRQLETRI